MAVARVPVISTRIANGTQTAFTFDFSLLGTFSTVLVETASSGSDVFIESFTPQDYLLDRGTSQINFTVPPLAGTQVRMTRCTDRNRLVNYVGGSTILAEQNLDAEADQLFSILQEVEEGGVERTVFGGVLAEVTTPVIFEFTGDGNQTDFEMLTIRSIVRGQAMVTVENVPQSPRPTDPVYNIISEDDSDYPSFGLGSDVLSFTSPPASGAAIVVRILRGVVVANIADDSIGTNQIANNAVTLEKINVGAGSTLRFMVFDAVGDPTARRITPADLDDSGYTADTAGATFVTAVRENRLDQMRVPQAGGTEINLANLARIIGLVTGTANDHAVNKGQMDTAIAGVGSVQFASRNLSASELPNRFTGPVTISIGFQPHLVILIGTPFNLADHTNGWRATPYIFLFAPGTTAIAYCGEQVAGVPVGDTLRGMELTAVALATAITTDFVNPTGSVITWQGELRFHAFRF